MKNITNWLVFYITLPLIDVAAFGVNVVFRPEIFPTGRCTASRFFSRKEQDSSNSKDIMEDAFRQLEELVSSEHDHFPPILERKKSLSESSSKEVREMILLIEGDDSPEMTTMSEAALFKDMFSELSEMSETDMIEKLKNELTGLPSANKDSVPSKSETELFMEVALDQALKEAEMEAQMGIDKDSLLENKEIMKEITMIFERANAELMEGIEEIRREQMALAVENSARNAKLSQDRIDDNQERLAAAEENMRKVLAKVNQETRNVEAAIEDLKRAQVDLQGGVDDKLMHLKRGGFVKQATLVGASLFGLRSIVEGIALVGGDTTHFIPAMLQCAIAVVCFVAFVAL